VKLAIVASIVLGGAGVAAAFPTGQQFDLDPMKEDGAGGIAFTGAPRWSNHTCAVCHTETPGKIGIRLEADKPELFTDGWRPNQQYHLRVVLENDWAGVALKAAGDNCGFSIEPYKACDQNGFALEMNDSAGRVVGKLVPVVANACVNSGTAPPDTDVRILTDGTAATHNGAHMGMTSWDLCWTAPGSGGGAITAFVTVVDGNGGDGTLAFPTNATGDDVAAGAVPIPEAGAAAPPPQTGGCNAGGDADRGLAIGIVLAVLLAVRRRRARLAAVLALATAAGCVHVRPRQRETLAKRSMKFAPDPAEDELDLHMQESREGSSGGYGSSGGGCGCN